MYQISLCSLTPSYIVATLDTQTGPSSHPSIAFYTGQDRYKIRTLQRFIERDCVLVIIYLWYPASCHHHSAGERRVCRRV